MSDLDLGNRLRDELQRRQIVIVGQVGVGKTTIGQLLSEELRLPFFDIDRELDRNLGRHRPTMTREQHGILTSEEEGVIRSITSNNGTIIATGGDTYIVHRVNILLRDSAIIVLLTAPIEARFNRINSRQADEPRTVARAWRQQILENTQPLLGADITVDNTGHPRETVYKIIQKLSDLLFTPSARISKISAEVDAASAHAPAFSAIRGRVRYVQADPVGKFGERKAATLRAAKNFAGACETKANMHPELKACADEYLVSVRALRRDRGAYRLFLAGVSLEMLIQTKSQSPEDSDTNPAMDVAFLHLANVLIVTHATLISIFPDLSSLVHELDSYNSQSGPVEALRHRVLDAPIAQLALSRGIFDQKTQAINDKFNTAHATKISPSQRETSAKHAWLRGALSALSSIVLKQLQAVGRAARDGLVKETVAVALRSHSLLTAAIVKLFETAAEVFGNLAQNLSHGFGWLRSIMDLLNL